MTKAGTSLAAAALLMGFALHAARAEEGVRLRPVEDPVTREECSACHMAYPASLLPARSWRALMSDLGNHFGEDASLDAKTAEHIRKWLEANAADTGGHLPGLMQGMSPGMTPLRISEVPIIRRIHGEVGSRWRKKVGSMARCNACHRGAENGYFEDD